MNFKTETLTGPIVVAVLALPSTTSMVRTSRSTEVHAKDYPTNQAVMRWSRKLPR